MFWGKGKRIEELVLRHLQQVDISLEAFDKALCAYVLDGDIATAKKLALETHRAEGKADDIRREVEKELLGGALLTSSRRDILEVIEQVDKLANSGEAVLDTLLLERIDVPDAIGAKVSEIAQITRDIIVEVNEAIHALFHNTAETTKHTKAIEEYEGKVDQIEREALKAIFTMDLDLAHKLQLRDFLEELVEISDRAEDLSDRLDIMVAERRL